MQQPSPPPSLYKHRGLSPRERNIAVRPDTADGCIYHFSVLNNDANDNDDNDDNDEDIFGSFSDRLRISFLQSQIPRGCKEEIVAFKGRGLSNGIGAAETFEELYGSKPPNAMAIQYGAQLKLKIWKELEEKKQSRGAMKSLITPQSPRSLDEYSNEEVVLSRRMMELAKPSPRMQRYIPVKRTEEEILATLAAISPSALPSPRKQHHVLIRNKLLQAISSKEVEEMKKKKYLESQERRKIAFAKYCENLETKKQQNSEKIKRKEEEFRSRLVKKGGEREMQRANRLMEIMIVALFMQKLQTQVARRRRMAISSSSSSISRYHNRHRSTSMSNVDDSCWIIDNQSHALRHLLSIVLGTRYLVKGKRNPYAAIKCSKMALRNCLTLILRDETGLLTFDHCSVLWRLLVRIHIERVVEAKNLAVNNIVLLLKEMVLSPPARMLTRKYMRRVRRVQRFWRRALFLHRFHRGMLLTMCLRTEKAAVIEEIKRQVKDALREPRTKTVVIASGMTMNREKTIMAVKHLKKDISRCAVMLGAPTKIPKEYLDYELKSMIKRCRMKEETWKLIADKLVEERQMKYTTMIQLYKSQLHRYEEAMNHQNTLRSILKEYVRDGNSALLNSEASSASSSSLSKPVKPTFPMKLDAGTLSDLLCTAFKLSEVNWNNQMEIFPSPQRFHDDVAAIATRWRAEAVYGRSSVSLKAKAIVNEGLNRLVKLSREKMAINVV